jgi:hypothetical protein
MMALAMLVVIAMVYVTATSRTDRAADRLADSRHAGHLAEEVLCDLQADLPLPPPDPDTKISIDPSEGGAKVPNRHWLQVTVTYRGQSAALTGLTPAPATTQPAGAR